MREKFLFLLSIPGLRRQDLQAMPRLSALFPQGGQRLDSTFPMVTWPAQATMLTGERPETHGIVGNGLYDRKTHKVEMWTFGNEAIQAPLIWDLLRQQNSRLRTAAWFPMLSKRCGADYVCMPAPVHHPDGTESLWCYSKPQSVYGELLPLLDHFPLKHFWGPFANISSTQWILDSAVYVVQQYKPNFFYVYVPHLDYAAQRDGPDSPSALRALDELDQALGSFIDRSREALGHTALDGAVDWMAVSEYTIGDVDHVLYPNQLLREAGLLAVRPSESGELLDLETSLAWALVDHQFSHLYVRDPGVVPRVVELFQGIDGVADLLVGEQRRSWGMQHARAGDVIVVSSPNSWQAYYWWLDDAKAPGFARTVDIHRKPGYDPVELFWDREANGVPLDATRVRGSHGAPHEREDGVLLSTFGECDEIRDTDVAQQVLQYFGAN